VDIKRACAMRRSGQLIQASLLGLLTNSQENSSAGKTYADAFRAGGATAHRDRPGRRLGGCEDPDSGFATYKKGPLLPNGAYRLAHVSPSTVEAGQSASDKNKRPIETLLTIGVNQNPF